MDGVLLGSQEAGWLGKTVRRGRAGDAVLLEVVDDALSLGLPCASRRTISPVRVCGSSAC